MRRGVLQLLAVLLSFTLIAAACGGDDDDTESAEPTAEATDTAEATASGDDTQSGGESATASGGETATATGGESVSATDTGAAGGDDAIALLTEAAQDPFPCLEGDGGTPTDSDPDRGVTADAVNVAYLDADLTTLLQLNVAVELGPSGDRFTAIMEDYNERCGGVNGRQVTVDVYTYDAINGPAMDEVCTQVTAEVPTLLSVTRVFPLSKDLCITEAGESILWYETGRPQESIDRAGGRLFSVDLPEDKQAFLQVGMLDQRGVFEGQTVAVVHQSAAEQTAVANDGYIAALAELGIEPLVINLQQAGVSCEGYPSAVQQLVDAGITLVMLVMSSICAPGLVGEAAAQAYFPQWVAANNAGLAGDVGTQGMVPLGDAFDGALTQMTLAQQVTGFPEGYNPAPWDQACNDFLNEKLGTDFQFGDGEFSAGVYICSAAYAILASLNAAGSELTQESFIEAVGTVDFVPLPRNQVGAYGPDQPWAAPARMFSLEWKADCGCWTYLDGPTDVE